ncbi:MAG: 3-oxoacyl-ACP reductase family protein [Candidatus Caenarcaniphilales bacterium]|nr:3-oxoacyl-ACP reductase family protein [Candidatus Caenarcaniphilales bacterium]
MSKTALVTGSSRGIGREIALTLAKDGYSVVVNYVSSEEAANKVVEEIKSIGAEAIAVKANVSNKDDLQKLIDETQKAFSSIDIVVNNAGITRDNLMIRMSEAEWTEVLNTNFVSIVNFTEMLIPIMKEQGKGKIINLTSTVGVHGNAGQANYAAAKSALISFTKIKARELMPFIQVNAIAPGLVKTDMTARFDLEKLSQTKLGRAANPSDIAQCVLWLANPSGDYVTGQTIEIDGGLFLWSDVEALAN